MSSSILIVDDEKNIRLMASTVLKKDGYHVVAVENAETALAELESTGFGLVLVDYMLPGSNGIELVKHMRADFPNAPPAVLMTAFGSVDVAVDAMRSGAVDYVSKPFTSEELLHVVKRNLKARRLEREVVELRARVDPTLLSKGTTLLAESPAMKRLLETVEQIAPSKAPVLIEGETGTGKERVAQLIHEKSTRADGPFIAVNCGALHPELLLSELFGHRKGAFTGAIEDRVGRFEAADGGTLLLDEIGELDQAAQVKLLRVLQEGAFERVGEGRTMHVDVRIIAATNRRLEEMVREGKFRSDLYFRLAVVTLSIPPLRKRAEDILPLADLFLEEYSTEAGRPPMHWTNAARQRLAAAEWKGNIRELRNVVQRAILTTPRNVTEIEPGEDLSSSNRGFATFGDTTLKSAAAAGWTLDQLEAEYLRALVHEGDMSSTEICERLHIDASTLWRKRKKYGI